ncbi:MAG: tRNA (guanine-N(1)-)-methyltransferase [Candidatus Magasanikbacteria bacterium GW2011_GWC2_40_17]|uniref:tRNA (guanine-N(1)-)-methyltransferase n=1 Tax=Candidatus Magasanikbacteria bacterium GW2011_GWA2_42_32 TaxID=1619039 RepID=A0A0G1CF65_9BACT|nr:MAG: tRNA (guanine-N(1)-)-methyltransferase [Candidatus Magasanikbacteria bacterium GW2011_GWC2_40_17]KKS57216.1 MAG: tRNA (guanine-N(1)-)-methyltransferase [Candidatus Magasanikbacteria bacterium GW2011_GWA2_42_32]OGH85943.1 MAG: tRNA (guanosine(37)-N1)-methyltransferase TrmD [Candidatus Magasanikbacteria bacterium RIFOXYB2_FULL_38_10]
MQFDILTIFPKIINDYVGESILKRAVAGGKIKIIAHDFRKFATDKHHKVDDHPYGGGAGMLLKIEPIYKCLESLDLVKEAKKKKQAGTKIIIMDPSGKKFDQKMAKKFSKLKKLVFICGRYEGFDERIYKFADEKISLGDYVLSGGELGALAITEAVARLVPGVLGNEESLKEETFESKEKMGVAEYPHYTRPENFIGMKVPQVLLSGDHQKIYEWRSKKSR